MAVVYVFNTLIYPDEFILFIPFAVSIFIFGLVASHLMKLTIKKYRMLRKKFASQIINLSAVGIFFSFIGTFIWMMVMMELGFWKIDREQYADWWEGFLHGYFFNLFPVMLTFSGWLLIYFLFHYVKRIRREERLKTTYKLQTTELEAKALRAQMNPHFIFNCLNSIKSLIQDEQKEKSIVYLTIFSKLIRTLLNNADKKEITLFDEIETCKLYLQLEGLRFDEKFSYSVNVDGAIDLKSLFVPALIIQPFIENAIWHGIVPKGSGGTVTLDVIRNNGNIEILVDDNGIGREASRLNKATANIGHQSKGVTLTQSRLELDNILQQRNAELEIIDKADEQEKAAGTKVVIRLPQED